jgi:ATP phosphoribosyltransferase regulatory subunit
MPAGGAAGNSRRTRPTAWLCHDAADVILGKAMNEVTAGLLPEGLRDRLPPQAEAAAALLRGVLDTVASHGYERVQPPLVEYEESLTGRVGAESGGNAKLLRFVDPVTQRTLALRPDITGQAGRIATTRLAHYARPLRLSYGGPVLRVKGTQLNPEREMIQAGAELIGSDGVAAVTEVLLLAVEALQSAGLETLSVDVTLPSFVGALAAGPWPVAADKIEAVHALLDGKDVAGLRAAGASHYEPLIAASGPAEAALAALRALHLGAAFEARLADVAEVVAALPADVRVTLDPTERHGFGFQSWIGFAIYAPGVRGEVGRGGAYAITHPDGHRETAVGFSLYVDALVDAGLGLSAARRILLPAGTSRADAAKLRAAGWSTVAALSDDADPHAFRCTHRWNGVEAVAI